VVGRFPSREEVIDNLFRTDETFRALCEDYCECLKSLARSVGQDTVNAPQYHQEYQELLAELGAEIMKYTDGHIAHP
jgi:hypothetical protein